VVHKGTRVQHLEHTGFGLALFCVQDRRTTPWSRDCMEVNVVLQQARQQARQIRGKQGQTRGRFQCADQGVLKVGWAGRQTPILKV